MKLSEHFAHMAMPEKLDIEINTPETFLVAFVNGCDTRGRYPRHLAHRLVWWLAGERVGAVQVDSWVADLIERQLLDSRPLYRDIYTGSEVEVLVLLKKGRYERFADRPPIPKALRESIYERDGRACVSCGKSERLSLDHKIPYSLGGEDTYENLQTMCVWCNSAKGNRLEGGES